MGFDKIIKLVGVLAAVVAGLYAYPFSAEIIAALGLVGGYFIADDDRPRFYMATVALFTVQAAVNVIPVAGPYVTSILGALFGLFSAACVTAIVMSTIDRVKP